MARTTQRRYPQAPKHTPLARRRAAEKRNRFLDKTTRRDDHGNTSSVTKPKAEIHLAANLRRNHVAQTSRAIARLQEQSYKEQLHDVLYGNDEDNFESAYLRDAFTRDFEALYVDEDPSPCPPLIKSFDDLWPEDFAFDYDLFDYDFFNVGVDFGFGPDPFSAGFDAS